MSIKGKEQQLTQTLKRRSMDLFKGMSANEIAASLKKAGNDFLKSEEWFRLKARAIATYGCTCMRCRKKIALWSHINVDHIKPRKYFPQLANDFNNLQILCAACNKSKGNKHDTDYRNT
jgi:5-methylcytosine-specific restriction endonuclease McrA